MERSVEPRRKSKEKRDKEPTPGTREWYERLREDHPEWYEGEHDV